LEEKPGKRLWTGPAEAMDVRTMPDRIAHEIRLAILRGDVRPGEALRQRDLAKRFGTSLIPVREALRCLERENLVSAHAYRGASVLGLSVDEITQVADLHHVIFSHTLRFALPASASAEGDRAEAILRELAADPDPVAAHGLLWNFYRVLLEPAHRPHAVEMLRTIWLRYMRYWPLVWRVLNVPGYSAPTLNDTVEAYRAKDLARMVEQSELRVQEFVRRVVSELALYEAESAATAARDAEAPAPVASRKKGTRRPRA